MDLALLGCHEPGAYSARREGETDVTMWLRVKGGRERAVQPRVLEVLRCVPQDPATMSADKA